MPYELTIIELAAEIDCDTIATPQDASRVDKDGQKSRNRYIGVIMVIYFVVFYMSYNGNDKHATSSDHWLMGGWLFLPTKQK